MLSAFAVIAASACAVLLYLASPHCRLARGGSPRALRGLASISATAAIAAAIAALGVGAGICTVLGAWMLVAVAAPYLALLWPARTPLERR